MSTEVPAASQRSGRLARNSWLRQIGLIALAIVFTVGLTFASVELPHWLDQLLLDTVHTPGFDSQASPTARFQANLFINHYHLRTIGYICFTLTVLLIIAGFLTRRSGIAAVGAFAFMLPVFAQFAGVMFFLAGLGLLNLLWMPLLDISFAMQDLGMIIRAPFDLLMWVGHQFDVSLFWPIAWTCIGGGLLFFFWGTATWLTSRASGRTVARGWIYRVSRHPQYLGWILWSYGMFVLLTLARYPKRSWGISASLPWLLATMAIIGVAMLEELNMRRRYGESYASYQRSAPFLFPVPRFIRTLFALPFRWLFHTDIPRRRREVVVVLAGYTFVLLLVSHVAYGGGWTSARNWVRSASAIEAELQALELDIHTEPHPRIRWFLTRRLAAYGQPAVPHVVNLLRDEYPGPRSDAVSIAAAVGSLEILAELKCCLTDPVPDIRAGAAKSLAQLGDHDAVDQIQPLLSDANGLVRRSAARALAELKAPGVVGLLIEGLDDPDMWVRIDFAYALGTLAADTAVPALAALLADSSVEVRRASVTALAQIGTESTRDPLRRAVKDANWEIRIFASKALNLLGPQ